MNKYILLIFLIMIFITNLAEAQVHYRDKMHSYAQAAIEKKNYDEAIKTYDALLVKYPKDYDTMTLKAYALAWASRYNNSIEIFEIILKKHPNHYDALMGKANVYYWQGKYKQANGVVEKVVGFYPEHNNPKHLKQKIQAAIKNTHTWQVDFNYTNYDFSFLTAGYGFDTTVHYKNRNRFSFRMGGGYLTKFGLTTWQGSFGATLWPTDKLTLAIDGSWSTDDIILPGQEYGFNITYRVLRSLTANFHYQYSDYQAANVHKFHSQIVWQWSRYFDAKLKYGFSLTDFSRSVEKNHSVTLQIGAQPMDWLYLYAGYSRTSESFESGNLSVPIGQFYSNHILGGGAIDMNDSIKLKFNVSYENRDNGTSATTFNLGTSIKF